MQPQNDARTDVLNRGQFRDWLDRHCRERRTALYSQRALRGAGPSIEHDERLDDDFLAIIDVFGAVTQVIITVTFCLILISTGTSYFQSLNRDVIAGQFRMIEQERELFEDKSAVADEPYTLHAMARADFARCGAATPCTLGEPERIVRMATTQSDQGQKWLEQLGPRYDGVDAAIYRFTASSPDGFADVHQAIQSTIEGRAGPLEYIASTTTDEPALYVFLER